MYAIYDPNWVCEIVPNLPRQYWEEYVTLLADFAPVALKKECFAPHVRNWHVFPFVNVNPESFDYEKFEEHECWVEQLMCEVYGLTSDDFIF